MASEEGAESEKVPRARLNHIAVRKLSALAITTRLRADGETLEGDLVFAAPPTHPIKKTPILKSAFTVMGHDRVHFSDAPLAALGAVSFYDVETSAAFEQRVVVALDRRMAALARVAERMRGLQMEVGLEPDRLLVRGMVRSTGFLFELLGAPEGVRVWRVTPTGGRPWDVPRTVPLLRLDAYQGAVDLEIHLTSSVSRWEQGRAEEKAEAPAAAASARPGLNVVLATDGLTVAMLRRFGDGATLLPGARLEVTQEFDADGARHRFVAVHEKGSMFQGRILGPTGEKWADRFDLLRFPGIAALLSTQLKLALPPATAPEPAPATAAAPAPAAASTLPDYLLPHAGEVWVMTVIIEQERDGEVRYSCTDPEGRPYGAPRILKRADFESVFATEKGGWRLCIIIDQLQGESVVYRQLDPQRQPRGAPKTLATSILVSTFSPESAVY